MVAVSLRSSIAWADESQEISRDSVDNVPSLGLRLGGMALSNGLIVVSEEHWAAAIRDEDGGISVASGKKPLLPGTGEGKGSGASSRPAGERYSHAGVPVVRGLGRLAESLMVLGNVKEQLPGARLPFETGRIAAALGVSMVGAAVVRVMAPGSALTQEVGSAVAVLMPAVLAIKGSPVSGYHGAEHKVIGAYERVVRAGAAAEHAGATVSAGSSEFASAGNTSTTPKEHDRCGSNLIGPFLLASVFANVLVRDRHGRKTPMRSAVASVVSLGVALEIMSWAGRNADSIVARLLLVPGKAIQKGLTTTEPTPEQLEVGRRAMQELLQLEGATH